MKIICSIGLSAWLMALAGLTHAQVVDDKTHFPDAPSQVETVCQDGHSCTVFNVTNSGKQKILDFPFPPSDVSYHAGTFVLLFPCGTACSATYFYNPQKGLGGPYNLVASYDMDKEVVLTVSANPPRLYQMFGPRKQKPIGTVPLNLDPNLPQAAASVSDVKLDRHTFVITYTDKDGNQSEFRQSVPSSH
jgi:hypothetical protein